MQKITALADLALKIRSGSPADAQICGEICYEAFKTISAHHNFPSDFASIDETKEIVSWLFSRPHIHSVVAELGGEIVGSNFLWSGAIVAGIGPLSVALNSQNTTVGRQLMQAVLDRCFQQGFAGARLVQTAFHNRSLALYTKLGFEVQEPLSNMQGEALELEIPGYRVRAAIINDLELCDRLCERVHGFNRHLEVAQAIQQGTATVVKQGDVLTGYATSIGFYGHAVGTSNEDIEALIGAARSFAGQGILVPTRNTELFRWCLQQGLRVVQPMMLMSRGFYHQPAGAFLPSILF